MPRRIEVLREVWRIVERRGGTVYRTKYLEDRWVPTTELDARPSNDSDLIWVVKGSDFRGDTIRSV